MAWFYESEGQPVGPISESELDALIGSGKIKRDTMVWSERMAEWQPLSVVRPAAPPSLTATVSKGVCVECGRTFPADELVTLNKSLVCAQCKPVFLQRMTEGVSTAPTAGLWRDGRRLVTRSETPFPDRCLKCNGPAHGFRLRRVVYWQHPAYYLLLLCNLIILLIVVLIVRKKAVLHIGLCETHRRQRSQAVLICLIGLFGGLALVIAGMLVPSAALAIVGVLIFLFGAIWGLARGQTVAATKMADGNVWVRGACPQFLEELPEWRDR